MSLPMKWWISTSSVATRCHQSSSFSPVALAPLARATPCSRSARRTRRTSSCRGCRESRSRSTARAARRPSRAAARRESVPSGSWRPRAAGGRPIASTPSRKPCSFSSSTNRCVAERSSGVAPESVLTGSIRSAGAVGAAALLAVVAVLVRRLADWDRSP